MVLKKCLLNSSLLLTLLMTKSSNITVKYNYLVDKMFQDVYIEYEDEIRIVIDRINIDTYTTYTTKLNEGLEIHNKSTKPGFNSTIIIMGHSGVGHNVYFNKLYQLNIDDKIEIYYSSKKYLYSIINIEYIDKNTPYNFNFNNNNLYLITCKGRQKQLLITAKMA